MSTTSAYSQLKDDPNEKKSRPNEIISKPLLTISTGIIIHKQSNNFIEIEAPVDRVLLSCSPLDPKSDVSHFGLDVEDENINYSFMPRRAMDDVPSCLSKLKEYKEMLRQAKTVRIVGESLMLYQYKKPPIGYKNDERPVRFRNKLKQISSFFIRLHANDKCKSYFTSGCDLPKNYWAGTHPIK